MLTVKKGGYVVNQDGTDVTNILPAVLFEPVKFDKIIFDDLIQLFSKHPITLGMLFPDLLMVLSESTLPRKLPEIPLTYLEIWWNLQYDKKRLFGNTTPDLHGIEKEETGETPYSLLFASPTELLELPIVLGQMEISTVEFGEEMLFHDVQYVKPEYTLANIIMAITEELALFDSPEEREANKQYTNVVYEQAIRQ